MQKYLVKIIILICWQKKRELWLAAAKKTNPALAALLLL